MGSSPTLIVVDYRSGEQNVYSYAIIGKGNFPEDYISVFKKFEMLGVIQVSHNCPTHLIRPKQLNSHTVDASLTSKNEK